MSLYVEGDVPFVSNGGNGNNGGMWGSDGIWAILLLALLGRNGFGGQSGNGGGSNCGCGGFDNFGYYLGQVATTNDVASGFSTSAIMSNQRESQLAMQQGFSDIQQTLCRGFSDVNLINERGFATTNYNLATGLCNIGHQISDCCCATQRAIDSINFNNSQNTCQIIQNQNAQTQRIFDYLVNKENQNLRDENFALRLSASQAKQNAYLINEIKPCPIPAYITCNPNTGLTYPQGLTQANFGGNSCCGCGNGF